MWLGFDNGIIIGFAIWHSIFIRIPVPDSEVHGANMGPTWVLSAPDGPHVGPMNPALRGTKRVIKIINLAAIFIRIPVPDSEVHGANMGPTWVLSAPDGPHVGPMNPALRGTKRVIKIINMAATIAYFYCHWSLSVNPMINFCAVREKNVVKIPTMLMNVKHSLEEGLWTSVVKPYKAMDSKPRKWNAAISRCFSRGQSWGISTIEFDFYAIASNVICKFKDIPWTQLVLSSMRYYEYALIHFVCLRSWF